MKIRIKVPRTEAAAFDIHFDAVKQFPHIASIFNNLRAVFHLADQPAFFPLPFLTPPPDDHSYTGKA